MKLFNLKDKVAIVTGASRGLGKAIAQGLSKAGAKVVISDVLDPKEAVEEIEGAVGIKADVTKKEDVQNLVKKTKEKFNKIDILINNAGILKSAPTEDMEEEDWDKVIDVNLKGQFLCAQTVGKEMIQQKSGKIINMASIAGKQSFAQSAPYNASKAGVILLTKTLAADWAQHNIQVNAICPGLFKTPMTEDMLQQESFQEMIKAKIPAKRPGQPNELMGTAIFLASEASNYMTGHALVIDGGWTCQL